MIQLKWTLALTHVPVVSHFESNLEEAQEIEQESAVQNAEDEQNVACRKVRKTEY